jgi:HEAT repeats
METNIQHLINKYNEGLADPAEVAELEKLIEAGTVAITDLHNLAKLDERIMKMEALSPSLELDAQFYAALAKEKKSIAKPQSSFSWSSLFQWNPQTGFALALLVVGLVSGYMINSVRPDSEVKELSNQITEMKEMMMLTMLEKESATDRLKAVSLTSDINNASKKVTDALFEVLNNDPSANVRMATLDALSAYAKNPAVRVRLVQSIASQDDPLVQIELAELMVELNEKSSVKELRKLMDGNTTPKEVKEKLKESIDVLI